MRRATRRNRARSACAVAGVLLAGLLAGCMHGPAGPQRASVESCTRFGISAIEHHVTITSVPAACRGLTGAQINFAVGTALHAVAGTVHGKARIRARALKLSPLLAQLVTAVPAQRGPGALAAAPAAGPAGTAGGLSLRLAALFAWLITVGLGSWMLAGWIAHGGPRRARSGQAGFPPSMIFAHFALAVAGLLAWIVFLITGVTSVAWIACGFLLPVAGLGMALVSLWLPERSLAAATLSVAHAVPGGAGAAPPPAGPDPPPVRHPPALIVAAHGVFAVATILFALLAAVGSG
jgi:hypothetical protein